MRPITESEVIEREARLTPEQLRRGYDRLLDALAEQHEREYRAELVRRCGLHAGQLDEEPERFDGGPV